jgi:hypothetical protein
MKTRPKKLAATPSEETALSQAKTQGILDYLGVELDSG